MANAWMDHVKAVKKHHPKKSLKEVLKMAAKSYKKGSATKKVAKKPVKARRAKQGKTVKHRKSSKRASRKSSRRGRK